MWPTLPRISAIFLAISILLAMEIKGMPLGRNERSSNGDIIAGVDFLSVFIRNAEERYYPEFTKTSSPFDVFDQPYNEDPTTKRPRFSISTKPTTTEPTTTTTTTRKPKLIIPTLPIIRAKSERTTTEPSTTTELRTPPPPITNSEVYKYIKIKTNRTEDEDKKENTFVGNSVRSETEKNKKEIQVTVSKAEESAISSEKEEVITEISTKVETEIKEEKSVDAVPAYEPSAIVSYSTKDELSIDEQDPMTIEATEINEQRQARVKIDGANLDYIAQQKRLHRSDESDFQRTPTRSARTNSNKARSISYTAVAQVPGEALPKNWRSDSTESNQNGEGVSQDYANKKDRKNLTETAAETKQYYVTSIYSSDEFNQEGNGENEKWDDGDFDEQHKLHHTTEKVWGTTEKNWGTQQTTPKVWGVQQTTPKVWGVQQTTPKVWGVQQTTPRVWGVQQTTPKVWGTTEKVWGVQQTTPKVWGVQQQPYVEPKSTPKVWATTEKNWGTQDKQYDANNRLYAEPEENYEIDESVSVLTNGRAHGIQKNDPDKPLQIKVGSPAKPNDNQKVGYVVEGRNYRKYRVEERTPDGFIVGEYGVVSNNDGSLRGVRYTADGTINPSVIYDALMKFLSL